MLSIVIYIVYVFLLIFCGSWRAWGWVGDRLMLPTHPGARQWANFHTVGHCSCLACIIQEVVCIIFSVISWKIYDLVSNTLANNLIILPSNHKVFMTLCPIHHQPWYWFFSSSFLSPVLFPEMKFFSYWYIWMSQSFYELGFSCIITVYAIQLLYRTLHFKR